MSSGPLNALTLDIEDYYQTFTARGVEVPGAARSYPDGGVRWLLERLAEAEVHATFFVLGSFAERNVELVRSIDAAGHEIGSHCYEHRKVSELTPAEFAADLQRSRDVLEGLIGKPVRAFRAPFFSLDEQDVRYTTALTDGGWVYDSSTLPVAGFLHGHPSAPAEPHLVEVGSGTFHEYPLATLPVAGTRLPWAGGFYLRIMPYALFRTGLRRINRRSGSAVLYLHNWEVDPEHPRLPCPVKLRFVHYQGLAGMRAKVRRLLRDFRLGPMRTVFGYDANA